MKIRATAFISFIKDKLKERSGETIVETLVSMLITVLAFLMLAGAIVAAARVNATAENHTMYVDQADVAGTNQEITGATVTVTAPSGTITTSMKVKKYRMSGSSGTLYYYE